MQLTQLLTICGGGAGYNLCVNTFAAILVEPEERTATFGRLQGLQAFGTALGLVGKPQNRPSCLLTVSFELNTAGLLQVGGWLGDRFGLPSPFIVAFVLLALSTIISGLFLPYIPPPTTEEANKSANDGGFFRPLKMFLPRLITVNEKETRFYGLFFIGLGSFVSTFATSTIQILLQLISTAAFNFTPSAVSFVPSLIVQDAVSDNFLCL